MLLSDINRYFATHKRACLADLATHFNADAQAIKPMLAILANKGRITPVTGNTNCGSCSRCDPDRLVIYEWCGN